MFLHVEDTTIYTLVSLGRQTIFHGLDCDASMRKPVALQGLKRFSRHTGIMASVCTKLGSSKAFGRLAAPSTVLRYVACLWYTRFKLPWFPQKAFDSLFSKPSPLELSPVLKNDAASCDVLPSPFIVHETRDWHELPSLLCVIPVCLGDLEEGNQLFRAPRS